MTTLKDSYALIQNALIVLAAKRVFEDHGRPDKLEAFKSFCADDAHKDKDLRAVDFLTHPFAFCMLPAKKSGAEPFQDSLLKLFFHEVTYKGRLLRSESFISTKDAFVTSYLKIACEEGLHHEMTKTFFPFSTVFVDKTRSDVEKGLGSEKSPEGEDK